MMLTMFVFGWEYSVWIIMVPALAMGDRLRSPVSVHGLQMWIRTLNLPRRSNAFRVRVVMGSRALVGDLIQEGQWARLVNMRFELIQKYVILFIFLKHRKTMAFYLLTTSAQQILTCALNPPFSSTMYSTFCFMPSGRRT